MKKNDHCLKDLWDTSSNVSTRGNERESQTKTFEEIIATNSPNFMIHINLQIQEFQQTPSIIKRSTNRHIVVKKLKAKGEKRKS